MSTYLTQLNGEILRQEEKAIRKMREAQIVGKKVPEDVIDMSRFSSQVKDDEDDEAADFFRSLNRGNSDEETDNILANASFGLKKP